VTEVILISVGCNYQNRNKTLASALSTLAKTKCITIEQLFLTKGHTMMEADTSLRLGKKNREQNCDRYL